MIAVATSTRLILSGYFDFDMYTKATPIVTLRNDMSQGIVEVYIVNMHQWGIDFADPKEVIVTFYEDVEEQAIKNFMKNKREGWVRIYRDNGSVSHYQVRNLTNFDLKDIEKCDAIALSAINALREGVEHYYDVSKRQGYVDYDIWTEINHDGSWGRR